MKKLTTKLLNLPGVIVEDSWDTEERIILSVRVIKRKVVSSVCSATNYCLYQNKVVLHGQHYLILTGRNGCTCLELPIFVILVKTQLTFYEINY
ncbi:hypothetical protein QT979_04385 [Microcoleus sp. w2-18bC1]|uniref:hypothetical protein n=1 Tax=unclassified Microcoleus TaxID=2642155 RepID=UPI002FD03351